jgi:hypothetical protein
LIFAPRPRPCYLDRLTYLGVRNGRQRWRDTRGRIYTYDGEHGGELEVFSGTTGVHIGVAHVMTGEFIKPPRRGRKIDVS